MCHCYQNGFPSTKCHHFLAGMNYFFSSSPHNCQTVSSWAPDM
uniref:Uncharacterized protein n=1 Tax=Arundo donax TaxID=35708 RepID=A0A0A9B4H1_ARUDO